MKKINLMLLAGFFSLNLLAQHNYDNQSVIYSNNGKIGLGTPTPNSFLDVHTTDHNSASGLVISQGDEAGNPNSGRLFFENSGQVSNSFVIMKGGNRLSFRGNAQAGNNSGTEYVSMTNTGRLGIGTGSPSSFLDVHTTDHNSASGLVISQGDEAGNPNSGRLFFENSGQVSNSFVIMKGGNKLSFRGNAQAGNNSGTEYMSMTNTGRVGIGTTNPQTTLHVAGDLRLDGGFFHRGTLKSQEIKVEIPDGTWKDYVFEKDYQLRTLKEVEDFIVKNKHLPEIPSEAEVTKNGINLGEMDAKLLQKIEELTLYTIAQQKLIETQAAQNSKQQEKIQKLEKENETLKSLSERLLAVEKQLNSKK